MAGSWGPVLTGLIPLGLVIALSPITVIPAVLVLQAARPRPSGLAFLAGWLLGLAGLTALCVGASGLLGGLHKSPPTWASWLRVALGVALILFGIFRWLTRHGQTESPGWMRSFATITPARAAITAAALVVMRPDVLLICVPAGLAIGASGLGVAGDWISAAFFVAIAASTVAIPIVAYAVAGHRLDDAMVRLKDWMEKNNAALMAAILVVIGLMVLYNGIHAL
ncbi:MAG: GAP family protein [Mycobacterium sp.]|uniref:GAP family protein n=1 Tax=Mycobacterium sp. TaxID=1785 RepID=UPI001ED20F02|nr:GAP family protein [Mycobacterium sp.]MBW0018193.1 GAP family protein [Mycobacterium sp.]